MSPRLGSEAEILRPKSWKRALVLASLAAVLLSPASRRVAAPQPRLPPSPLAPDVGLPGLFALAL